MAWVTPSNRATGDLVTAAIWNQDVVANPAYLKGQAGVIVKENSIAPTLDNTFDIGNSFTARWRDMYAMRIWQFGFGGPPRRRITIPWEDDNDTNYQATAATGAGGAVQMGGPGQTVLTVSEDALNKAGYLIGGANNGAATFTWLASKKLYYRVEIHNDSYGTTAGSIQWWVGFRSFLNATAGTGTATGTIMPTSTEDCAVVRLNTGSLELFVSNGSAAGATSTVDLSAWLASGTRHIVELFMPNATRVEARIDNTLAGTTTLNAPTGSLAPVIMFRSTVNGTANVRKMTIGEWIIEQDI